MSDRGGEELGEKLRLYDEIGVSYYVVFDPALYLGTDRLSVFERRGGRYQQVSRAWFSALGLGMILWEGRFEDLETLWLRWCTYDEKLLPTAEEVAVAAGERADQAESRAAETQRQLDVLRELLRRNGIEPPA